MAAPSRAAHSERGPRCGEAAGVAKAQRAEPRQGLLAPYAPQPSDEPIGSELGRGVRVVAAGAAGAGALFSEACGLRADGGTRGTD